MRRRAVKPFAQPTSAHPPTISTLQQDFSRVIVNQTFPFQATAITQPTTAQPTDRLTLQQDFTRFMGDDTFPFKVTAIIGNSQIPCSGVLISQQSEVMEQKIRDENGVLIFEEFAGIENCEETLKDCLFFLHGAALTFSVYTIANILKFASFYKIENLFFKGLSWITDCHQIGVSETIYYFKIANCLHSEDSEKLKSAILNCISCGAEASEVLITTSDAITGEDIAMILQRRPVQQFIEIFEQWLSLSPTNRKFPISNSTLFNFINIYPNLDDFSRFMSIISQDQLDANHVTKLLEIQKNYMSIKAVLDEEKNAVARGRDARAFRFRR